MKQNLTPEQEGESAVSSEEEKAVIGSSRNADFNLPSNMPVVIPADAQDVQISAPTLKPRKTLQDVRPMSEEKLQEALENLSPFVYDKIKDRLDTIPVNIQEALVQKIFIPRRLMVKYGIPFTRHQMRQLALEAIYQYLLLGGDIRKILYNVMQGSNEVDGYLYSLVIDTIDNREEYTELISSKLRRDWSFDRLSLLDQAILLMSCQEILENQTPKAAVINEAVQLCKEYSEPESASLINAILDTIQ